MYWFSIAVQPITTNLVASNSIRLFSASVGQESGHVAGLTVSSHMAIIKASAGVAISTKAQLEKDPLLCAELRSLQL